MTYENKDLAVVPEAQRNWTVGNYAALWIGMSMCIPTYMLASSMIEGGMNWWQALATVFLGNVIVLVPMILNGHAGARYGIPFPVLARASFGILGANIPAMLRAIVACGWFGIQSWIGGAALYRLVAVWAPGIRNLPPFFPQALGMETGVGIAFFTFWALNMVVIYFGINSIRRLLSIKAVVLPMISLALLLWAISAVDGLGPILARPARWQNSAEFWAYFFPALTGVVGFWATISLNIPDFTRYASSQRAHILGQAIGLPTSMTAFAFVGIAVTSATALIYGEMIWDPVILSEKFTSPLLVTAAMLAIVVSTLATNIAANIVSPANDFANLAPRWISFRTGGYITGVIGVVIMPWRLVSDPTGYIFKWLIAYSALLGPIGGILIVDYYLVRRCTLDVDALYSNHGRYWYTAGFNWRAIVALIAGILPSIPGFLVAINAIGPDAAPGYLNALYHYAWFVGFGVAGSLYFIFQKSSGEDDHKVRR